MPGIVGIITSYYTNYLSSYKKYCQ